jgi:hypothetical protein
MRRPEIVADAAIAIVTRDARTTTGRFFLDEEVLAEAGITNLERYAVKPGTPLLPDLSSRVSVPALALFAAPGPPEASAIAEVVVDLGRPDSARRFVACGCRRVALARFAIADVVVDMGRRDGARRLVRRFARRLGSGRARLAIADIVVDLGRPRGARFAIAWRGAGIRPAPMAVAAAPLLALTAAGTGGCIGSTRRIGTIAARRSFGPLPRPGPVAEVIRCPEDLPARRPEP